MLGAAALLGPGCTLAAIAPFYWTFAAALALIGVATLSFTNATQWRPAKCNDCRLPLFMPASRRYLSAQRE